MDVILLYIVLKAQENILEVHKHVWFVQCDICSQVHKYEPFETLAYIGHVKIKKTEDQEPGLEKHKTSMGYTLVG